MINYFFRSPLSLRVIFILCVSIIFFIGGITYKHIELLKVKTEWVEHTYQTNIEIEKLMSYIKDAETGQRGYILTGNKEFLKPYLTANSKIENSYNKVTKLIDDNIVQQNNLRKIRLLMNKRMNTLSFNLYEYDHKHQVDKLMLIKFDEGKFIMEHLRLEIDNMINLEKKLLIKRQKEYQETIQYTPIYIYLTLLFTLLLIVISYVKMSRDFTELKKTNNDLQLTIDATRLGEEIGKYGIWQWDIKKNKFYFSDNLYRLLAVEPKSFPMTAESFLKFIHPEDIEYVTNKTLEMMENKELPTFYYRLVKATGEIIHVKVFGKTVIDQLGNQIIQAFTIDITNELEYQRTVEERNRILEENNKELQSFNYVASHDLQEPLRKIQTFISRLDEKDGNNLSDNGKEYLKRIISSAERMRVLINDLLQYSRTSRSDKVFEKTNLNELYDHALVDLAQLIEDKKAIISCDNLPSLNVIPYQVQQLFINLLSNSLKYSKPNLAPKIDISCKKITAQDEPLLKKSTKDKYYKIVFKDNGIGFEQEYAEKIFILFNRLHGKTDYSGTGIGLAICKKIIENHNGFIFAKGKVDKGATFTIYLPEN